MKKLAIFLCAVALVFSVVGNVWATPIWGSDASSELSSTRDSGTGGIFVEGIEANDEWNNGNFTLGWVITEDLGLWTYNYTITTTEHAISHFILEVTVDDNFSISHEYEPPDYIVEGPKLWEEGSGGNPNMPNDIYGIKFDFGGNPITYTFVTDRAPVYGVFYGKDGTGSGGVLEAWSDALNNPNYRTDEGLTANAFIVRPNGAPVPEPATLLLLGSGLIGLAGIGRKKLLRSKK